MGTCDIEEEVEEEEDGEEFDDDERLGDMNAEDLELINNLMVIQRRPLEEERVCVARKWWMKDVNLIKDWKEEMAMIPDEDEMVIQENLRAVKNYQAVKIRLEYMFGEVPKVLMDDLQVTGDGE